jgi:acyl-CoA thioesterase FadM
MLTAAFGRAWLSGGRLKIRFKGAARPGDVVTARGRVQRVEGERGICSVECLNQQGEVLIAGQAEVKL